MKSRRGFASMDPKKLAEIASLGGKAEMPRERIMKSRITMTILARESECRRYAAIEDGLKLADEDTDGPCLGEYEQSLWEEVPPDQVEAECLAMGNDGTFFDEEDELHCVKCGCDLHEDGTCPEGCPQELGT